MLNTNVFECNNLEEIKTATEKLDKAIEVCPLKFDVAGVEKQTSNFKGVYNISKGIYTKTVSAHMYHLINHKHFIDIFSNALTNLNIAFKATINDIGNTVISDYEFIEKINKYEHLGEEFVTGIRLISSYDKNFPIVIMPRLKRLACLNGMVLSRDETKFNVKHSSQLAKEIEKLVSIKINQILNRYEDLQLMIESCIGDSIEWKLAVKIIEKLVVQPKHLECILKNLNIDRIVTPNLNDKKHPTITYLSSTLQETDKLTRWQLYNAITQYATHGEQISTYVEMFLQNKAEKLLLTPLLKWQ